MAIKIPFTYKSYSDAPFATFADRHIKSPGPTLILLVAFIFFFPLGMCCYTLGVGGTIFFSFVCPFATFFLFPAIWKGAELGDNLARLERERKKDKAGKNRFWRTIILWNIAFLLPAIVLCILKLVLKM